MLNTSQTTRDSTVGSTKASTVRQPWAKWTKEELQKIQKEEIRDLFYIACRRDDVREFLATHFPKRTKQAVWHKVWQIEKRSAKFCSKCGGKIQ